MFSMTPSTKQQQVDSSSDDDGENLNCQIRHELSAGTVYVIKVRGFSGGVTGDYVLHLGPVVEAP